MREPYGVWGGMSEDDREAIYQQPNGDEQFRASHFRPLQDLGRITSHVVAQVLRRGGMWQVYRSIRAHPPLIDDPSGEFAPATAAPTAIDHGPGSAPNSRPRRAASSPSASKATLPSARRVRTEIFKPRAPAGCSRAGESCE